MSWHLLGAEHDDRECDLPQVLQRLMGLTIGYTPADSHFSTQSNRPTPYSILSCQPPGTA